jgi:NACHT domain
LVFQRTHIEQEASLPLGTSIVQAYDDAGQGLLILGTPGAGKTTLLLSLARELLTRAKDDPVHPISVILNLSSWRSKNPQLASWLVDQLRLVYGIPSRLCQAFLKQEPWLLLLDGLDEVEASERAACIEAINLYREEYFAPLVVCSRSHEYVTLRARLALSYAVEIQPLQEQEVMEYLKRIGKPVAATRTALRTNPVLKPLLTTPLLLNVVILAYRDKAVKDLPKLGSTEEQQQQIFARYVERMLERPTIRSSFTQEQTRQWLTWLAQQMQQQHLSEFYLERLQPTWLPTKQSQLLYYALNSLIVGMVTGLVAGLVSRLVFGPVVGLIAGPVVGVIVGPGLGLREGRQEIRPKEMLKWSWKHFWRGLVVGLVSLALIAGLFAELVVKPGTGLATGLVSGLIGGPLLGLLWDLSGEQIEEDARNTPNLRNT